MSYNYIIYFFIIYQYNSDLFKSSKINKEEDSMKIVSIFNKINI